MIDLSPFLTPTPRPNLAAPGSGADAIGDLAEFQAKQRVTQQEMALKQQQLEQQGQIAAATNATNREHIAGQNKYYDMQADTHRMAVEDRANEARQKQLTNLEQAFRKAKDPAQRQLIIQAYKRLGYAAKEEDTAAADLNAPAVQGSSQAAPAAASTALDLPWAKDFMAGGTTKPNQPPDWLSNEMSKEGVPPQRPQSISLDGFPEAPKPAAPAALKRGGRHVITDPKTGETILDYDAPLQKQKGEAEMLAVLQPYVQDPANPQQAEAAKRAAALGAATFDSTGDKQFSITAAKDMMAKEMGQYKKTALPGHGGGGGGEAGPGKTDIKLQGMDNAQADKIRDDVARDYSFKAAVGSADDARQGLALMQQLDSGFGDASTFGQFLNSISGKVVSDKERAFYMGSEGFWTEMSAKVAKYTSGGRLPPELMHELKQRFLTTIETANERRQQAAKTARETALRTPGTEGSADMLEGYFSGNWKPPADSNRLSKKPSKGAVAPAPAGGDDAYAAWLKAHPRP